MDEVAAHLNHSLEIVSTVYFIGIPVIHTPPGICLPLNMVPEAGTTRGRGDATPGLILRDSLMTAV